MDVPRVSVVVPLYDEQEILPELHARLQQALKRVHGGSEIVFVNDGSRDGTLGLLQAIQFVDRHVRVVSLSRNFGHQAAVAAGLAHARGAAVAVLDGDLQDPPELLPALFDTLDEGWDVVYGVRRRRKEGLLMRLAYFVFYRLLRRVAEVDVPVDSGDFCAMRRRVVDLLNRLPETDRYVRGLRAWLGFRQTAFPYERDRRHAGRSKYTFSRLVTLSLDGLVSLSFVPLRLLTGIGLALSSASFVGILVVLYRYLATPYVPGYTSLAVLILFFGGLQLMAVGLVGEYVGRISRQVKGRPLYVVDDLLGFEETSPSGRRAR